MQTYPLKLAATTAIPINVDANLFVYESGTATPSTGDTRIRVKPDNGEEIVLRPGQRFRIPEKKAQRWSVSTFDGATAIDGMIIIGSGEFDDANTLNSVKLDASFANKVTVMNDSISVSGNTVNYTHTYNGNTASVGLTAIQMLPAATNVNGAILEKLDVLTGTAHTFVVLAKATAPANMGDGDVMATGVNSGVVFSLDVSKNGRVRAPAGKAIWYMTTSTDGVSASGFRSALFTVL